MRIAVAYQYEIFYDVYVIYVFFRLILRQVSFLNNLQFLFLGRAEKRRGSKTTGSFGETLSASEDICRGAGVEVDTSLINIREFVQDDVCVQCVSAKTE